MLAHLATRLVDLVVDEYQVVLVDEVLHEEEEECEERDQRHKYSEQEASQEDYEAVRLVIANIELILVLVPRLDD